jgi:hypothetical protein
MVRLPVLGSNLHELLYKLVAGREANTEEQIYRDRIQLIEEVSQSIINELKRQELSE